MKKLWLYLFLAALSGCSKRQHNEGSATMRPEAVDSGVIIGAVKNLKVIPDKNAFLVFIDASDETHYFQFKMHDGRLVFERPILAESTEGLPVVPARYYVPISDRPKIESPVTTSFLSPQEATLTANYLDRWGLSTARTFIATKEPKGVVVEYFEQFEGPFTITDERIPEFVFGYFHSVYGTELSNLKLKLKTK